MVVFGLGTYVWQAKEYSLINRKRWALTHSEYRISL